MNHSLLLLPAHTDKANLLNAFAEHCQFGTYFGHNWDALWDSLNDWLAQQPMPLCLELDDSQLQSRDEAAWQQCQAVLEDARIEWPDFSYRIRSKSACCP